MSGKSQPDVRSYRVTRSAACDDFLTGEGLYFRTRAKGGLIVFGKDGWAMGVYERGDWTGITDETPRVEKDQPA